MHHFFVGPSQVQEGKICIEGSDINHMKNVLRMKTGELLEVNDGCGNLYMCEVEAYEEEAAWVKILERYDAVSELPAKIYLFQGLPKGDKMELIIQKAVELGVYEIIPVATKRAVVKLDEKKAAKKVQRWNAIAEGGAKQSGRGLIPKVTEVLTFGQALQKAKELDVVLIPYEKAEGMEATLQAVQSVEPGKSVAVFIGPEGGFEEEEITKAMESGAVPVSLGKRILRTETAGLMILSVLMYHLECFPLS
ncbi:MAG: 16S rRNA (uracil(1498)-N(3))-methyltransferase [Ruminococcus sp.]|nr:16S rRNA (uracil(1498)-N(3))-methyltransferase [Ruminococcus sp.]